MQAQARRVQRSALLLEAGAGFPPVVVNSFCAPTSCTMAWHPGQQRRSSAPPPLAVDYSAPLDATTLIVEVAAGAFAFKNKIKATSIKLLWDKLCEFVSATLKAQKGVLLPNLGTFKVGPCVGESKKKIRPAFALLEGRYGGVSQERARYVIGERAALFCGRSGGRGQPATAPQVWLRRAAALEPDPSSRPANAQGAGRPSSSRATTSCPRRRASTAAPRSGWWPSCCSAWACTSSRGDPCGSVSKQAAHTQRSARCSRGVGAHQLRERRHPPCAARSGGLPGTGHHAHQPRRAL